MNILIIGNGFDLAHGLPTKYADFLKFIDFFYKHKAQESSRLELIAGEDIHCYKYFTDLFNSKQDSEFDQYLYDQSRKTIHELSDLCKDNAWIKYFSEVYKSREQKGKDGWIDFESEISLIIQTFNSVSRDIQETIQKGGVGTVLSQRQLNVLALFLEKMDSSSGMATHVWKKEEIDFWKQKLLEDLNKLTRALEIYLSDYISNFMLGNGLPDIKNLPYLDKILSFNYTCTYQRIYGEHPFLEFDYVHGKAVLRNDIQSTNMVLGIDEYLEGDARDKDLEFIEFKKFFQRIHKETVGKSSITNALQENVQMETGEISKKLKRGKHTTRHSQVIPVGHDTYLMDTPGFSSLYLTDIEEQELKAYFPEFRRYEEQCRFQGCRHIHEPDCGVKAALAEHEISQLRYEDYLGLYNELKEKRRF